MRSLRLMLCTLLLVSMQLLAAPQHTYTIPVQHQLPEQLRPLVEPLLAPGGVVTLFGNHLIIKTTAANYAEIEPLIRQFDQPAQQLLISVRSPTKNSRENRNYGVTGTLSGKNGEIQIGDGQVPDNGIRIGRDEDQAYYSYGTRRDDSDGIRQVRTLEGSTALINTGVEIPTRHWIDGPNGYVDNSFKHVEQGFYVTVRLAGNGEAIIEIAAQNDQLSRESPRRINTQEANTVIRAPVGQWVRFGDINTENNQQNKEIGSRSYSAGKRSGYFEIKVDPL